MTNNGVIYRLNPSFKLLTHVFFMLLLTVIRDPMTSLLLILIPITAVFTLVQLPKRKLLVYSVPFIPLFLISVWSLAAFGRGETIWFTWAWFHFTKEGLLNGLTIGLRMLGFLFYGLLFVLTTDITSFVLSLMQQLRLRPKWAYSLLAAARFFPLFKDEFEHIRAAHRVRGVHRAQGIRARGQAMLRYTIPLLSQGIRQAERVAIALEARAFDGSWNRTFYRDIDAGRRDLYYFLILFALHACVIAFSAVFGYIQWGLML